MIEVSYSQFFVLPLTLNLLAIVLWWTYYAVRDSTRKVSASGSRIYRCAVCAHVYADRRDVPLARCPRCGCLNEAVRR